MTAPPIPSRPTNGAPLEEKWLWLRLTHAYYAPNDTVVELYKPSDACHMKPLAFQRKFRAWREEVAGPRGGRSFAYATEYWEADELRPTIEGIRMRPDKEFPTFLEGNELLKNTYRRPAHEGEGDLQPFLDFMKRFLPDKGEREWLYDWMAHKQLKPEVPGTAVLLIADNDEGIRKGKFGTGRGFFFRIVHKLYGEHYARAQKFSILDGSSSQSVFTNWMHGSVLVTVDEAKTSPTAYRRGERSAVYEVLKEIVDPAPKQHHFTVKHGQPFDGMSYCSYMVACNSSSALTIPSDDRRFTMLRNGRKMVPQEAKAIAAWMELPGNIAALSRMLAERDLANFNMYEPLDTDAKAEMAELALSPVENVLRDLMDDEKRGLVFTRVQLQQAVEDVLSGSRYGRKASGYWHGEFDAAWNEYCALLKSKNKSPRRVRVGGLQTKVYCFRTRRKQAEKLPEAALRRQAAKWGPVDELKEQLRAVKGGPGMFSSGGTAEPTEKDE